MASHRYRHHFLCGKQLTLVPARRPGRNASREPMPPLHHSLYESSMVTKIGQTNRQQNLIENFLGNVTTSDWMDSVKRQ